MRELIERLDNLLDVYEYSDTDKFVVEPICGHIILKSEIVEILYKLIEKNVNDPKITLLLDCINQNTDGSHERRAIKGCIYCYKNILLYSKYNVLHYKLNDFINKLNFRRNFVENEIERFYGFNKNQNVYDNYLSIIKIIKRCSLENINLNLSLDFNNNEDVTSDIAKNILNDIYSEFSIVRFIV